MKEKFIPGIYTLVRVDNFYALFLPIIKITECPDASLPASKS
ncbi:MAG: hypothetical protein SGI96_07265 [Bacteroidota bacterium]|nr:hypothetical protein [Bacteroidota bacterium]